jgi:hypothetical protein
MNLRKLTIVPMLAMALFAVGCGGDCVSQCEDAKDCDDATAEDKDADCDKICEDAEKAAKDAGCEDEYSDAESCLAGEDACDAEAALKACESEFEAYVKCATPDA